MYPEAFIDRVIANYRLEQVIGVGGMGGVYIGRKVDGLAEVAAIKILMPPWQSSPQERVNFRERFVREAQTLGRLRHPHILPLISFGEEDGLTYLLLPYMVGGTLATRLAAGQLPMPDVVNYLTQLASALDYAHQQGVIHRDIKPSNILLGEKGQLYLSDFSIARLFDARHTTLTGTGAVMGTLGYMSPEQAQGQQATPASDQYSLGVVLYELVTGQQLAQVRSAAGGQIPPPQQFRPDLPEAAARPIMQALALDPAQRWPTAGSLVQAFTTGLRQSPPSAPRSAPFAPQTLPPAPHVPTAFGQPYGPPPSTPPPGYGAAPPSHPPPGYGAPPSYPPPGYGSPPNYPPPGYGGAPANYPVPGYGATPPGALPFPPQAAGPSASLYGGKKTPIAGIISASASVVLIVALLIILIPRFRGGSTGTSSAANGGSPTTTGPAGTAGPGATATPSIAGLYNFAYNPTVPGTKGGTVVIGDWETPDSLTPIISYGSYTNADISIVNGLIDSCVVQLPDLSQGAAGWKPDQCTVVPTVANGGESADGLTTTMHLDSRMRWSDGTPITADDYLLQYDFGIDPNVGGNVSPWNLMRGVKKIDANTVQISWSAPYASYLWALWNPVPLHIYNAGKYAGLYNAATQQYSTTIAQQLIQDPMVLTNISVTNGPFTVQSFGSGDTVTLRRNPNFASNVFKGPFLDSVIFKVASNKSALIQAYLAGQYDHVEDFTLADISQFGGAAPNEMVVSSALALEHLEFNQRPEALNAAKNGGTSIFADQKVRQAFIQAFDRCAALQAATGYKNCSDPNVSSDEFTVPPALDDDPTVKLPGFDRVAAATLLEQAGYHLVNGQRMFKDGKTPMTVTIVSTANNAVRDAYLALIKQAYSSLNIAVVTQTNPGNKLYDSFTGGGILATGAFDIALFAYNNSSDPDAYLLPWQSNQIPSAQQIYGQNYSGIQDANVDAQLAAGRQTLDVTKRMQIYKDLQKYVTNAFYWETLFVRASISLTKTTLGNFKAHPSFYNGDTWNMADWYKS